MSPETGSRRIDIFFYGLFMDETLLRDVVKDDLNCLFVPSLRDGKLNWLAGPASTGRAKITPTLRVDDNSSS